MSAAQVVFVETIRPLEAPVPAPAVEETIGELVHELRQPLSSIEAIAYYLEMTLPGDQVQARQYMWRLQELIVQANTVLQQAAHTARKPCTRAPALEHKT